MSSPLPRDELGEGSAFGSYQVVRRLGAGAFGSVYEALKLPLRKRTALKVLHRQHTVNHEVVQRFLREAEIVAQLEHPHIVGVFDLGTQDGQPFIAMEFLEGRTLADLLKAGEPLRAEVAIELLLAVMSAVAAVHEKGIVHRDLKPDNIFIARLPTGGTRPMLLDFGIAKIVEDTRSMTRSDALMGTPCYMSPEQVHESKNVGPPSDQWALAVILFECLSGKTPFDRSSLLAVLTAITSEPLPRLQEVVPSAPSGLDAVLLRAMNREPAERWPSVRAFGAALLPYATSSVRSQWERFYAAPVSPADASREAALPASDEASGEPDIAHAATLEPATTPSMARAAKPRRGAVWAAVGALALASIAVGSWRTIRHGEPVPTPIAAAVQPTPAVPVSAVALHDSPTDPAPTIPPQAAPTPADAPAPAITSPESAPVAASPATSRRTSHRRSRPHPRRPRVCPNGICPPDD